MRTVDLVGFAAPPSLCSVSSCSTLQAALGEPGCAPGLVLPSPADARGAAGSAGSDGVVLGSHLGLEIDASTFVLIMCVSDTVGPLSDTLWY